ncbi:MAG: regulatory protein RecX [Brevinema sp.]
MRISNKSLSSEQLLNKSLYYIKYRMRSEKEVITKLKTLKATEEQISTTINTLKEYGLIQDAKVIEAAVREFLEIKGYGLSRAKRELLFKGYDSHLIEDTLQTYCDEHDYNEEDVILNILEQTYTSYREMPDDQKILAKLARKGFSFSTAKKALDKFKQQL